MSDFKLKGLEDLDRKLKQLSNPRKVKNIARKALRQGANVVRDAARQNAKDVDDPETADKIWKNIAVQGGKSRNSSDVVMRIGVRGGASFSNPNPPKTPGGDTRHWRWIELGASHFPPVPFMRPALNTNTQPVTNRFIQVFNTELDKELQIK
jgi:HK97 gp10 family phage protein